jgi:GMP synthase (glutamine-hydrolysing)
LEDNILTLIGRKVREKGVYSEIVPYDMKVEEIDSNVKGIILSGGPYHVSEDSPKIDPRILDLGIPILGICYGHQLIAYMSGGKSRSFKEERIWNYLY